LIWQGVFYYEFNSERRYVSTWKNSTCTRKYDASLGLLELVDPCAIIPVGYPIGKFGRVSRRTLKYVVHLDYC